MNLESLVALNSSGMVGHVLFRRLMQRFGSPEAALRAPRSELERVQGVGGVTSQAIVDNRHRGASEIEAAEKAGGRIIPFDSPDYPPALRSLYDQPLVLYMRGTITEEDSLSIGVVGSRDCTPYGERQARRFGEDLAGLTVTVVSGLARGIDTYAHLGALKKGRTIAVLGSGLGRMYPRENGRLAARIAERGAVLSEFPMDAEPARANFPRRNRIIAGLSLAILIVEAREKSGALITADWAMESGRDVFCLPGSVESPMSRGCHLLLRQGARLAESALDILEEIPALAPLLGERPATLSPIERTVMGHIGKYPVEVEQLVARTRLPGTIVKKSIAALVKKELAKDEGGYLSRV